MGATPRVAAAFADQLWAILPSKMDALCEVVARRSSGLMLTREEIDARLQAAQSSRAKAAQTPSSVAVIRIDGVIVHRASLFSDISGATSTEHLLASFRSALEDPDIRAIVLDIDSPGGSVAGVPELADVIFAARGQKPTFAVANSMAASAALWLGVAAESFSVIPSGQAGSIGVMAVHDDFSKQNEQIGYVPTYVYSGAHKVEFNSDSPLSPDARAYLLKQVNATADTFRAFVAKARNVTVEQVIEDFGDGRMLLAKDAKRAGLVDRIETWDQAMNRAAARARTGPAIPKAEAPAGLVEVADQLAPSQELTAAGAPDHDVQTKADADRDFLDLLLMGKARR